MDKQKIRVTVFEARGIKAADIGGTSDPYCEIRVKNQELAGKTKTIKKTLNPFWNEEFDVYYKSVEYDVLSVKIYDHDAFGSNDLLGEIELPIAAALNKLNKGEEWFQLQERKGSSFAAAKGEVRLGFKGQSTTVPPPYNPSFTAQQYPPAYPPQQQQYQQQYAPPTYPTQYVPPNQNYPPPQYPPNYPPQYPPTQNYPPPTNYPPQNVPPQNFPPQNFPPQNFPPQNYPPTQQYPPTPAPVTIVTTTVVPQQPLYPSIQEDYTVIESLHNGKVLDIEGGSSNPGAKVIVYSRHGNANQLWKMTPDGHIVSKLGGLALAFQVRDDNTILIVDSFKEHDNQRWFIDGDKIVNKATQEALQIRETDGQVILWYPSPQPVQRWKFTMSHSSSSTTSSRSEEHHHHSHGVPEDWMTIESRHSGYLLDIEGANGKSGAKVIVWSHNNGDNQKWKYKKGFIKSKLNKKLVLTFNSEGTLVVEKKEKHDDRQRWEIRENGLIVNVSNGKAIDIAGESRSQGARVVVWDKHGNSNQLWNLKKA